MGFIDLEKAYNSVNSEALWLVLKKYDVGGKLLSGIKSVYVDSLTCIKVKGGDIEQFRIYSGVRKGVYHIPLAFQCIHGYSDEGSEDGDGKDGRE